MQKNHVADWQGWVYSYIKENDCESRKALIMP